MNSDSLDNRKKTRSRWRVLVICISLGVGLWMGVRHVVPSGLGGYRNIVPYLCSSRSRGFFAAPDGTKRVEVVSSDAGAAHSGCFFSWVVVRRWWGKQVVAKGYLEESRGPVPLTWVSNTSFTVVFAKGRYSETLETVTVDLSPGGEKKREEKKGVGSLIRSKTPLQAGRQWKVE